MYVTYIDAFQGAPITRAVQTQHLETHRPVLDCLAPLGLFNSLRHLFDQKDRDQKIQSLLKQMEEFSAQVLQVGVSESVHSMHLPMLATMPLLELTETPARTARPISLLPSAEHVSEMSEPQRGRCIQLQLVVIRSKYLRRSGYLGM
jgi:hypothetical protein